MNLFERVFRWAGGVIFAGAIAFCGYTFLVAWSGGGPFHRTAIGIDMLLFTLFAFHHSAFARTPVKAWLARFVPDRLLRSVYVWIASLLLLSLCVAWQPVGGDAYGIAGWRAAIHAGVQLTGVAIIAGAVRTIDALELAGIREHLVHQPLQIVGPYRWVRHPLYLGWMLATFGTAHMTGDRLVFAIVSAFYLVLAIPLEERSLLDGFGGTYAEYQQRVRWRIVPYLY